MILEEDLAISVDILSYFKQLLPVLEHDESLYCISAWNDQVSENQSGDTGGGQWGERGCTVQASPGERQN